MVRSTVRFCTSWVVCMVTAVWLWFPGQAFFLISGPPLPQARWLRKQFPIEERYRILIHAHAGDGNTQDAASIEAALNGGNGVWSAVIPQARACLHF